MPLFKLYRDGFVEEPRYKSIVVQAVSCPWNSVGVCSLSVENVECPWMIWNKEQGVSISLDNVLDQSISVLFRHIRILSHLNHEHHHHHSFTFGDS